MRVLIAGTARCGSTWLTNVVSRAAETRGVYEPDGPISDVLGAMVANRLGDHPVLAVDQPSRWYSLVWELAFSGGWPWDRIEGARSAGRRLVRMPPALRDYLIAGLAASTSTLRRRPRHVVVKSVNSAFALDWIVARYRPRVVILRRNPLNVVSSWLVLGMWTDRALGMHPLVDATYLRPRGLAPPHQGQSRISITAWNVGLLLTALKRSAELHPDWIVESHDEICLDPVPRFRSLLNRLGLEWTPAIDSYIASSEDPTFTVHGGSSKLHPNAVTATTADGRRVQQATQFRRRLSEEQTAEACAVLERFDLGEWGVPPLAS